MVVGAMLSILVLSLLGQSSRPVVLSAHAGMDASVEGVLRTAVAEMRAMRLQVSQLERRVHGLRASDHEPSAAAPHALRAQPGVERAAVALTADDGWRPGFGLLANVTGSQPTCGMLVFRHIEKTGGTTFRMHMVALHECGWHVWGFKGTIRLCNKAKAEWETLKDGPQRAAAGPGGRPLLPHLAVESHSEHGDYARMLDAWTPLVQAWRGTCGIWLISIVREPLHRQVCARTARARAKPPSACRPASQPTRLAQPPPRGR